MKHIIFITKYYLNNRSNNNKTQLLWITNKKPHATITTSQYFQKQYLKKSQLKFCKERLMKKTPIF